MAKFCTKCGKELVDGKCLKCVEEKEAVATTPVASSNGNFDFNDCVNSFIDMVKGMFTRPKDTIVKYASDKHMVYGVIAMVLCAVLTGVFGYLFTKELLGSLTGLMFGSYSSLMGGSSLSTEIPAFKTILITTLYGLVTFAVIIGMVYFMVKVVFKKEVSIKKIVASFGPLAIFSAVNLLVAIVLLYISVKFMLIVYLVLSLCYVVYMIQAIKVATDVEDNYLAYTYVPAIAVAVFVVGYILPKLFS